MKLFFVLISFFCGSLVYSQKFNEIDRSSIMIKKGIDIVKSDLNNISDYDFELIKNYNFDGFRNEKTDRKIQLVRGPLISVKSFNYCNSNQISFDEKIYLSKNNELENTNSNFIITELNIGLGIHRVNRLN